MQWKHVDSSPSKKFRTQPSAGKVMATIFWDSEGLLLIDYLPSKITGQYYVELMFKLCDAIKQKRRGISFSWNPVCRRWIAESCCWSVVWRPGQRILFSRHKQLSRKVAKMHWCCWRLYWKMTICLKVCSYFLYQSCKTFCTLLVVLWHSRARLHTPSLISRIIQLTSSERPQQVAQISDPT